MKVKPRGCGKQFNGYINYNSKMLLIIELNSQGGGLYKLSTRFNTITTYFKKGSSPLKKELERIMCAFRSLNYKHVIIF
jgi:hypothetical protein